MDDLKTVLSPHQMLKDPIISVGHNYWSLILLSLNDLLSSTKIKCFPTMAVLLVAFAVNAYKKSFTEYKRA